MNKRHLKALEYLPAVLEALEALEEDKERLYALVPRQAPPPPRYPIPNGDGRVYMPMPEEAAQYAPPPRPRTPPDSAAFREWLAQQDIRARGGDPGRQNPQNVAKREERGEFIRGLKEAGVIQNQAESLRGPPGGATAPPREESIEGGVDEDGNAMVGPEAPRKHQGFD